MAETTKRDIVFNIKQIDTFRKGKEEVLSLIQAKKKDIKKAMASLEDKKSKLTSIKESVENDKKRQQQEQEVQTKLLEQEKATPLFDVKPVVKVESTGKVATDKPVKMEKSEKTEIKSEVSPAPITEKILSKHEKPVIKEEKPVLKAEIKEETKPEPKPFEHSVFANNKKPKIELPKVRVFIPAPVEPKKPFNRDASTRPPYNRDRNSFGGPRDFNNNGRPNFGAPNGTGTPNSPNGTNTFNRRPDFNNNSRPPYNKDFKPSLGGVGSKIAKVFTPPPAFLANSKDSKKKIDEKKRLNQTDEKKDFSKKDLIKNSFTAIQYDEDGEITKIRSRKAILDKKKSFGPQPINITNAIISTDALTIKTLSEKIGKPGTEIIRKLFILGIFKSINDVIDFDTASLVSSELGIELELKIEKTQEEKLIASFVVDEQDDPKDLKERPPIVTIMGHVDHGKTSILDYIRKANVAGGEAGGITQHIGAYSIMLNGKAITFLDTPGHEAFTAMRARGANITDIVVVVVAADDGLMPQTIEAISHAKAANVSVIVAVNKMDKPTADPDRILTQLSEHGITPEDWGGETPVVKVSAKTGLGMNALLENILTTAEVLELRANPDRPANGTIIEARLDKGKGPVATVLVQNGTLNVSDFAVVGNTVGRIRAMFDDKGRQVKKAGPSIAVSILGLQDVPNAGDQIMIVSDEKIAKQVIEERKSKDKENLIVTNKVSLDDVFGRIAEGKLKDLNLIIKADVQGSAEAIKQSLLKLSNEEVKVVVVHSGAGAINETDVTLADTTNAIIIGFNVRPDTNAKAVADKSNIDIRCYKIIYDAIDDVQKAINGMLAPKYREEFLGRAEIRQIFKLSTVGSIAGCMVKDGKIVRNSKVRVLRDGKQIHEGMLGSLKRMKDDVKEVATGFECGLSIENFAEIKEGDIVEAYHMIRI